MILITHMHKVNGTGSIRLPYVRVIKQREAEKVKKALCEKHRCQEVHLEYIELNF